ncbi:MAG TPA: chloride channel protein, partial [Nitrososphaeria archaeon]|nr:chloride channel protein [Nitrososphaeria archaeon]
MLLFSVDLRKFEDMFRAIVARHYFRKWIPLSVIIGVAAGFSAIAFYEMLRHATTTLLTGIAGYHPPAPAGEGETFFKFPETPCLIPLVTCIGGLISGLLVYLFAPEAEGHGTDAAIDSFHNKQGEIRMRVPLIKMVASAITIGSGGSAGREGPIALTSAGVASIVGKLFKLTEKDRRIAVAVGIGSGIGAIFRAPFGGAILAAEILYLRDLEIEALVPSFIASVIAYSIFSMVYGWQPIFESGEQYLFKDPLSLIYYAFLGVLCGLIGILYVKSFYGVKSLFDRWRIPNVFKPAVGGLLLGIIGIWIPHILGTSYGWLQKVILGDFSAVSASLIIAIIFLKIVATALTVGSGGSGGVFAPALVIGGMTGAATWLLFHSLGMMPEASPAPYVIVGMMAFFGGVG